MTKLHESFLRNDIDKINMFKTLVKGELTVVISENNTKSSFFDEKKITQKS